MRLSLLLIFMLFIFGCHKKDDNFNKSFSQGIFLRNNFKDQEKILVNDPQKAATYFNQHRFLIEDEILCNIFQKSNKDLTNFINYLNYDLSWYVKCTLKSGNLIQLKYLLKKDQDFFSNRSNPEYPAGLSDGNMNGKSRSALEMVIIPFQVTKKHPLDYEMKYYEVLLKLINQNPELLSDEVYGKIYWHVLDYSQKVNNYSVFKKLFKLDQDGKHFKEIWDTLNFRSSFSKKTIDLVFKILKR